jgi:hypothetical protein
MLLSIGPFQGICCHAAQGAKVTVALFYNSNKSEWKITKKYFSSSFIFSSHLFHFVDKKESRHNFEPATPSTLSQTGPVLQIFSPSQPLS